MSALWQDRHAVPPWTVQALTREDLDTVLRIEQTAYSHPWTRGNFEDSLASGYRLQGLVSDGQVRGYCVAMEGVQEVHLLNITVAPDFQRQGLACCLLDDLTQWSRTRGAQWLWLEVRQSNARALQVYARYGFRQVGVRKNYYPVRAGREDAVVMSLSLNAPTDPL